MIINRLIHTLISNRKWDESEKLLNVSLNLSEKLTSHPELVFNSHRNILAFYTHTDIVKATQYVDYLLSNDKLNKHFKKYFIYAAGVILCLI